MMFQEKIAQIAKKGHINWQRHALQRMMERDISREEVKHVLKNGELIEEYPDDFPLPSGLFLGYTEYNKPRHVVAAVDYEINQCYIVTAYQPDLEHFEADCKTRKR